MMKFTILIFALLQTAVLATLRGAQSGAEDDTLMQIPRGRKLPNDMFMGGMDGGGCPPVGYTFDPNYTPCDSNNDCVGECAGNSDCCCVDHPGNFNYCGVPSDCNDFLTCIANNDDRETIPNNGPPIEVFDQFGCNLITGEQWCEALGVCTADTMLCQNVVLDEFGCATAAGEVWCERRGLCIINGTFPGSNTETISCPPTSSDPDPPPPCAAKTLVPISLGNIGYDIRNGQIFYQNPTVIRGALTDNTGTFIRSIDFTLLPEEWQLDCTVPYDIYAYFTENLRLLHVCYKDPYGLVQDDGTFPIPSCQPTNINRLNNMFFEFWFMAF